MEMDKHGGNIYEYPNIKVDFSTNLSPLGMPEEIKKSIIDSISEYEVYPDTKQRKLRERIGCFYNSKFKNEISDEIQLAQIVCGSGAADLIFRIPEVIKTRGGSRCALIVAPAFSEYEESLNKSDFDIEFYYTRKEKGFKVEGDLIDRVLDGDYDLVFICNPANPTGVLVENSILKRLLEACESKATYLVVDECFLELTDVEKEMTLIPYIHSHKHLMVLRSFTKTYAMAGLRLGYIMCGDHDIAELLLESGQPWAVSKPAEIAGLAALEVGEKSDRGIESYLDKNRRLLGEERSKLYFSLKEMGLEVLEPSANYIFFFGPYGLDDGLRNRGFLIRNCENYEGISLPNGMGAYRIAIRLPDENELLMEAIRESL